MPGLLAVFHGLRVTGHDESILKRPLGRVHGERQFNEFGLCVQEAVAEYLLDYGFWDINVPCSLRL